ncbi:MAG: NADH-quinone oxidoreductase subunit M [Ignavibacteriota bacterium]|jgi:NADH-quinone oxidoreductase subunit M|nr:MAG: NADH-quinone oxidoreductase subunit M [Chlorobiota bacterium]MBE7475224.1 NADH-quinone oxidoreductase subunit M [Ignavibacteriales bacterium]MBL1122190.1 NADH-quinone oxidoreductase subunit M [Ignavibacteriota bacterium]MCE7856988.1 NADH-quinone oxidoreductase subunit M [Ignavibacteria bacterium CHB3]MCZ7616005.1 NADH-quinone oxidoreductase subunit M [Ignavibacteriaceae bacterium]MEB2296380.1 NADH-quinone oxidoreductase subunit M [Ignavibacteria bacterium]
MIIIWIILILIITGLAAWYSGKFNENLPRWISLIGLLIDFMIILIFWLSEPITINLTSNDNWLVRFNSEWIPQFGISLNFALDGLSLILVVLTIFLGILSVLTSWTEIKDRIGFFHFNLLWILAGIVGVFTSLDLFLFYFFWELMLVPMYFLIGIWGHEKRIYAAYKFFIFTQASGLLMLLSILGLYFIHGNQTGIYTFNYFELLLTQLPSGMEWLLMFGFLIAFAVKLPLVPVHNWLPDAHTQAPTAGSVILAGLLLKTGAYGLLRFVLPLFPNVSIEFAPYAMFLGVIGILYGAKLAFAQNDFKRLVAYSSVNHMGFVMLGVYSFNVLAYQGAVFEMITHAISTSALFIIVGLLSDRLHTRNLDEMGGLWEQVPKMGGIAMVFVMASLGLPGLGNFIAEFLVLAGSFQASVLWSVLGSLGLIASAIYALRIMQKVWHERKAKEWKIKDYIPRELIILGSLILVIVWLGLFPQKIFSTISSSINSIHDRINDAKILLINNSIKTEIITNSSVNNEINTNQQKDDK